MPCLQIHFNVLTQEIHRFTLVCVFLQAPWVVAGWKSLIVFVFWASMYILKNAFGIFWLWELGFRLTRLGSQEISHWLWGNLSPNPSPTLGKSVTDFGEIRSNFGEMRHRFWGKTCAFFGKNRLRFWEKHAPFLGKTCSVLGTNKLRFWEKHVPFLGKNMLRFWEEQAPFFGKNGFDLRGNWLGFWIGLGQSSSLTVLNAKHVWVWIFEVLGRGVSKNKSTGGKLER